MSFKPPIKAVYLIQYVFSNLPHLNNILVICFYLRFYRVILKRFVKQICAVLFFLYVIIPVFVKTNPWIHSKLVFLNMGKSAVTMDTFKTCNILNMDKFVLLPLIYPSCVVLYMGKLIVTANTFLNRVSVTVVPELCPMNFIYTCIHLLDTLMIFGFSTSI